MDDRREKPETSRMGSLLGVAALILVAYPLSTGPMAWLVVNGYIPEDNAFIEAIYLPLGVLCEMVPSFDFALFWYIGHWAPIS